jgi:hypothetical protein
LNQARARFSKREGPAESVVDRRDRPAGAGPVPASGIGDQREAREGESVYLDLEVPDLRDAPIAVSALALGYADGPLLTC